MARFSCSICILIKTIAPLFSLGSPPYVKPAGVWKGKSQSITEALTKLQQLGESFSLGFLEDIHKRTGCGLCRAISAALPREFWGTRHVPKGGGTKISVRLQEYEKIKVGPDRGMVMEILDEEDLTEPAHWRYSSHRMSYEALERMIHSHLVITELYLNGYCATYGPYKRPDVSKHHLVNGQNDLSCRFDIKGHFSALNIALKQCEAKHRSCRALVPQSEVPENMLLIDVGRKCLTSAPRQAHYFALSYVWGSTEMLQTTTENLTELMKPQSLVHCAGLIPEVIKDAVKVVEAMGGSYLWVDALCIVQNDSVTKHDQIQQMHKIYGQAVLTLIAMRGKDANSRLFDHGKVHYSRDLPGHNVLGEEILLGGEAIVGKTPRLSPLLMASYYNKRGWTFQERILSVRCLYFAANNTYFQCSETICDDWGFALEDEPIKNDLHVLNPFASAYKMIDEVKNMKRSTWKFQPPIPQTSINCHQFLAYANLLSEYTAKRLSFDSDILNAFTGILHQVFEGTSKDTCGLPERDFDAALLWFPQEQAKRRGLIKLHQEHGQAKSYFFPSWSWAGWKDTPIVYPIDTTGETSTWETRQLKSCINTFNILSPGNEARLIEKRHTLLPRSYFGIEQEDLVSNAELSIVPSEILIFHADFVPLFQLPLGHRLASEPADPYSPTVWMLSDSLGRRCGIFISDVGEINTSMESFDWILLSQNQNLEFRPEAPELWLRLSKEDIYDVSYFGGEWVTGNLMLIQWVRQYGRGVVAERVGMGFVHMHAWESLCVGNKVVRLI